MELDKIASNAAEKVAGVEKALGSASDVVSGEKDLGKALDEALPDGAVPKLNGDALPEAKDAATSRWKNIASKLPDAKQVGKAASAVSNLASALQDENSDKLGAFSNFYSDLTKKDPKEEDAEENGSSDDVAKETTRATGKGSVNDKGKATADNTHKPVDVPKELPGMNGGTPPDKDNGTAGTSRWQKIRANLPDSKRVGNVATAFSNLASALQGKGSASDKVDAFVNFHADLKRKEADGETGSSEDVELGGEFQDSSPYQVAAELDRKDAESEGGKRRCTKCRIAYIFFLFLSYGAVITLGYFNLQTRLEKGRGDLGACRDVQKFPSLVAIHSGVYNMRGAEGSRYQTYCDMATDGGGWTLVASVHDNDPLVSGRCTVGDRWSSQQGNSPSRPGGDNTWANLDTFGSAVSATSDDFKSQAYFDMHARDVMIWQVPNDTPMQHWREAAYLRYHTTDGFLAEYGHNLQQFYRYHFPVVSGQFSESGPSVEVRLEYGNLSSIVPRFPPILQSGLTPGYIQFRAVNQFGKAYALCPGVKISGAASDHAHHVCIGSTGDNFLPNGCGDFAGLYNSAPAWSSNLQLLNSSFLIFYR